MIATTIRSSIKVKPVSFLVIVLLFRMRWSSQVGRGVPIWAEETQRNPEFGRLAGLVESRVADAGFPALPMSKRVFASQAYLVLRL
jgi:hypothetical protein